MIGANIKKLRLQHGLTQKNLADKLFVSAQAVSRWENDEVEPSISTILELAKIFGVTADEIINPDGNTAKKTEDEKDTDNNQNDQTAQEESNKEDSKSQEPKLQLLALCSCCSKPIYDANEIVRKNEAIVCRKCSQEKERVKNENELYQAKKRRVRSFIFGPLSALACFACTLGSDKFQFEPVDTNLIRILISIAMFTFVSCCILNNNFVGYMFLRIATWSLKAPGLIFTLDLDGCLWFIGTKILLAILGVLLAIFMCFLALAIGLAVSIFVYPYAIIMNFKNPNNTYI